MTITVSAKTPRIDVRFHPTPTYAAGTPRILCATDLSASSDHAVHRALQLADSLEAECLLLHVVDENEPMRIIGRRADRALSGLKWHTRQFASFAVTPEISVRIGSPHRTILRAVKEWNADLIVLGTSGISRSKSNRWRIAERLCRSTARPVLIVNSPAAQPYTGVTITADSPKLFSPLARLAYEFDLFHHAQVSIVPTRTFVGRLMKQLIGSIGLIEQKYLQRLQHRERQKLDSELARSELNGMGFEIVQRHCSTAELGARIAEMETPQVLLSAVGPMAPVLGRSRDSLAHHVLKKAGCDLMLVSRAALRRLFTIDTSYLEQTELIGDLTT